MKNNSNIDAMDRSILRALQKYGRLSMLDLSDMVGLSATPCARRVKRLEKEGVILGYNAHLDERKIGYGFSVFVSIQLDKQVADALQSFERAVAAFPEVVSCWLMTGNRDYLMRVSVADLQGFELFLMSKLNKVDGVTSIESSIPIRQAKYNHSRVV